MRVVLQTTWNTTAAWRAELLRQAPDLDVRVWPEIGDPAEIDAVLCWQPPPDLFAGMRNLRLIQILGAGVDGLLRAHPRLPPVPVARLVDPVMSQRMAEYCLYATLRFHRQFDLYERQLAQAKWERHQHPDPAEIGVGVMGLGAIGSAVVRLLRQLGYNVAAWTRSPHPEAEVPVFVGEEGLPAFLARTRILICLLPLTPETASILDRRLFEQLPRGSWLVNAARGEHLVVPHLLAALETGRLEGAMLDVFAHEPLPKSSPLWRHPKVFVTPHAAGITNPRTATAVIVAQLRRLERGEPLAHLVDPARGY
ncbi:MAG: glyoxylate/hydroxypyruvate reductase A [Geminicoccaceae bacterium]|nr:glyoxylate/hydroxypyruvate reductase A [Geminicoccaceae bacterium]MCX8100521.1 glyoxylate/hydroxypyruvate reductase A [Geminicoccaceae bacterium]MDW8370270.1 glyoxylate/hydroxypyruvate reductase A [Geminicoccaceae bacterium]